MGHGAVVPISVTMTSGATLTPQIDLGRNWEKVYLSTASMVSNSQLYIQASEVTSGTFSRVCHPCINSSTVSTPNDFAIGSAATGRMIPIPNGFRYIKIESTMTLDNGMLFKVICSDAG